MKWEGERKEEDNLLLTDYVLFYIINLTLLCSNKAKAEGAHLVVSFYCVCSIFLLETFEV